LTFALETLKEAKGNIEFKIYGPIEDEKYWRECLAIVENLPKNIHVVYCGEVNHSDITKVLSEHHFMLFPTLGENFGHTIAECLQVGCPVIISDRTPWNSISAHGAGWVIPLENPDRFVELLEYLSEMNNTEYLNASAKTEAYWRRYIEDSSRTIESQYVRLFSLG
jgi:glycosyltransferase involved in cell wall biosynthesis